MLSSHRKYIQLFLVLIACLFLSCNQLPDEIQSVLNSSDYANSELKIVIDHYQKLGNDQKLKAAYYLIDHLPEQKHTTGEGVANYRALFPRLLIVNDQRKLRYDLVWDSLVRVSGLRFPGYTEQEADQQTIRGSFLINHIDASFRAWQYPWAKKLTFEEFCEYILPYKLVNEQAADWMDKIQKQYSWLVDSMKGGDDVYKACLLVNNQLKKKFTINSLPTYWDVNFNQLDSAATGKCYHATQYTAYVMRALGIPVVMDYTISWGNMNGGHNWNALIYNRKSIPFVGCESDPGKTKIDLAFQRKRAKIFRFSYSEQPNSLAMINNEEEDIPAHLANNRLMDVTDSYIHTTDVQIKLNSVAKDARFVYLCVFNRQSWIPVYWSEIKNSNEADFKKMGRGIVYLPAYYTGGELTPAGKPFILTEDGQIRELTNKKVKPTLISVDKKSPQGPNINQGATYEVYKWDQQWVLLKKQTADKKALKFNDVTANSLYWLHSPDKSTKERMFTYEGKKLIWW